MAELDDREGRGSSFLVTDKRAISTLRCDPRSVYAPPMASAELSRHVRKVVAYPPLCK